MKQRFAILALKNLINWTKTDNEWRNRRQIVGQTNRSKTHISPNTGLLLIIIS